MTGTVIWVCRKCGTHNLWSRGLCETCNTAHSGEQKKWKCDQCGYVNDWSYNKCRRCGSPYD